MNKEVTVVYTNGEREIIKDVKSTNMNEDFVVFKKNFDLSVIIKKDYILKISEMGKE